MNRVPGKLTRRRLKIDAYSIIVTTVAFLVPCNEWESKIGGNSPIGRCCYSLIFKESKLLPEKKDKGMRKRK